MIDCVQIEKQITPILKTIGYDLVRVRVGGGGRHRLTLQIMIEHSDWTSPTLEECCIVSRTLSEFLELHALITTPYSLEISSPGLDRPLTRLQDFQRFKDSKIHLETQKPIEGRRRYHGILRGLVEEHNIILETDQQTFSIPFSNLQRAKLLN